MESDRLILHLGRDPLAQQGLSGTVPYSTMLDKPKWQNRVNIPLFDFKIFFMKYITNSNYDNNI